MTKPFKTTVPRRQHGGWDVTFKTKASPDMVERLNALVQKASDYRMVEHLDLRAFFAAHGVRCPSCHTWGSLAAQSFHREPPSVERRSFHVMVVCVNCQANRHVMVVTPRLPPRETGECVLDALARDLRDHGWCAP